MPDAPEGEVQNVKRMYLAGALAQANRILSFLDSDLPEKRKHALLRRVARECESFKREIMEAAKHAD